MKRSRWLVGSVVVLALAAAACGDDDGTAAADDAPAGGLADICPDPLVVQTDWFPEPEHGFTYQAAGVDGTFDADNGIYTGPLVGTDIMLEIRAGGPYTDADTQTAQFYTDPDIFMAYVNTDRAIQSAAVTPVVHVLNYFERGPQILMWDPDVHDFETFADIGESGARVLYFGGAAYMDYLVADGQISRDQIDGSYDGSPTRFIAEGDLVQQGFATNEPYRYENELGFGKPVDFLLIDEVLPIYQGALSVKPEALTESRECLEAVVPIFQQATVDYFADPEPVNELLLELVVELDSFWTASAESHAAGTQAMIDLGLVTDGPDGTVGDFDADRIAGLIDQLTPVYEAAGIDVPDDLTADDLFTNEFLDPDISLGF